ncbi:hypothetical protein GPECTOR_1g59 [Gonium pectorale]|uniref:Glycosyltransferase family 61 protein n=1 Tax=Gonium pectorale TaxID=33097 RepID=A0A150H3M6_GONPE|nr:hypothetical protein GPECTOR_1g59 [Gonium pectorale]|eukprot:KXZ56654.1 hypothetical protein GPECTOR_1g59 [Gonium pectorale]
MPGFFSREAARAWIDANYGPQVQGQTGGNRRVIVDELAGRLVFAGLRGQNLVFRNVRFVEDQLPATWVGNSSHCLGHMTSVTQWREGLSEREMEHGPVKSKMLPEHDDEVLVEEAAIYLTPDNERYQHWLDHTAKPIVQSAHLVTNKTLIVPDQLRTKTDRKIINEEEAKAAIIQLLEERGKGEHLVVYPPSMPPYDPLEYVRWLNRNVLAVIGPHGGGLGNLKWLAAGALVLEMMPANWLNVHFYEEAIGHGLNYWVDILVSIRMGWKLPVT